MKLSITHQMLEWEDVRGHSPDMLDQSHFSNFDHIFFEIHAEPPLRVLMHTHAPIGTVVSSKVRPPAVLQHIFGWPSVLRPAGSIHQERPPEGFLLGAS